MIAWLRRLLGREPRFYARLRMADGSTVFVGPSDHFTAAFFIETRISPTPWYDGRRVASSKVVGR